MGSKSAVFCLPGPPPAQIAHAKIIIENYKLENKKPEFYCTVQKIEPERSLRLELWSGWKARKSVSRLSAQPTEILGTKLKLSRQRALGLELGRILGRINLALAGKVRV
jgi:hypothetical protein